MGNKTPKIALSSWHCVIPTDEDRATAIGNMQAKFGKNRACASGDMLADKQTHRHTHTHTHTHTDLRITILRHRYCGPNNKCDLNKAFVYLEVR